MRSFKIISFLPLLILLYNLHIICAKKVLLTCNNRIAARCGTLNPAKKYIYIYDLKGIFVHVNAGNDLDYAHQKLLW